MSDRLRERLGTNQHTQRPAAHSARPPSVQFSTATFMQFSPAANMQMPGAGIEPAWGCPRGILSRVEGPDNTARYDTIRHKNNDLRPSSNSTFAVLCGIVPQVLGTNWAQSGFTPSASSSPRTAGNRASARKGHGRIAMDRVPNEVRIGGTVPKRGPGPQEHRK